MDLCAGGRDLTLTRRTARANSPMSAFSAVYTGTASPVEGLTASDCGELLLGVPQEVYVRSALIRQGGVNANAVLLAFCSLMVLYILGAYLLLMASFPSL